MLLPFLQSYFRNLNLSLSLPKLSEARMVDKFSELNISCDMLQQIQTKKLCLSTCQRKRMGVLFIDTTNSTRNVSKMFV